MQHPQAIGPFLFKLSKLDREGIVINSNPTYIPLEGDSARANVEVAVSMPKVRGGRGCHMRVTQRRASRRELRPHAGRVPLDSTGWARRHYAQAQRPTSLLP